MPPQTRTRPLYVCDITLWEVSTLQGMERTDAAHHGARGTAAQPLKDPDHQWTQREFVPHPFVCRDNVTGMGREEFVRVLTAALALALLFLASAFGGETERSTLRIGITPDYPPFSHIDDGGKFSGFDVDIAMALCARLEVECAFIRHDWEELIPGLRNGEFDAIVSSMSITENAGIWCPSLTGTTAMSSVS